MARKKQNQEQFPPVDGEFALKRRLAVQTTRGNGSFGVDDPFVATEVTKPLGKGDRLGEARLRIGEPQLALIEELLQSVAELGSEDH